MQRGWRKVSASVLPKVIGRPSKRSLKIASSSAASKAQNPPVRLRPLPLLAFDPVASNWPMLPSSCHWPPDASSVPPASMEYQSITLSSPAPAVDDKKMTVEKMNIRMTWSPGVELERDQSQMIAGRTSNQSRLRTSCTDHAAKVRRKTLFFSHDLIYCAETGG